MEMVIYGGFKNSKHKRVAKKLKSHVTGLSRRHCHSRAFATVFTKVGLNGFHEKIKLEVYKYRGEKAKTILINFSIF